jgi:hypothetical protein
MVGICEFVLEIYNFLDIGESCARIKIVNNGRRHFCDGELGLIKISYKIQIVCRFTFNPIILTRNRNVLVREMYF